MTGYVIRNRNVWLSGVRIARLYPEKRVEGRPQWYSVCAGEGDTQDGQPFLGCYAETDTVMGQRTAADDALAHFAASHGSSDLEPSSAVDSLA